MSNVEAIATLIGKTTAGYEFNEVDQYGMLGQTTMLPEFANNVADILLEHGTLTFDDGRPFENGAAMVVQIFKTGNMESNYVLLGSKDIVDRLTRGMIVGLKSRMMIHTGWDADFIPYLTVSMFDNGTVSSVHRVVRETKSFRVLNIGEPADTVLEEPRLSVILLDAQIDGIFKAVNIFPTAHTSEG
jgi:hypothetical protein